MTRRCVPVPVRRVLRAAVAPDFERRPCEGAGVFDPVL